MADVYAPSSMGTYVTPTQVISAPAQVEVLAVLDVLKALIPDPNDTSPDANPHPDFMDIQPHTADKLRDEIDAAKTAIDAAPAA